LETPDRPGVRLLLQQADDRSSFLYPEESRHGLGIAAFLSLQATFFVARVDQRAVGCGGFVRGEPGQAELKRMFVTDAARGRGVGRALLCAAENAAVQQDIRLMQLETGVKSSEAIGLYRSAGYRERGPFGQYRPAPLSVFMEKMLTLSTRRSEAALGMHPHAGPQSRRVNRLAAVP